MFSRLALIFVLVTVSGCGVSSRSANSYYGKTENYTVVRGDTLSEIANRFATSTDQLSDLNYLDDPDILEPGQTLKVPASYSGSTQKSTSVKPQIKTSKTYFQGGQLLWPVANGYVISKFGPRGGESGFHDGLDIAAVIGTPVYAAHDGVVVYSDNELGGYGELVIIKSITSLITIYAHNSERLVKVGDRVQKGDLISEVGQTGRAEGPHLHFEVRVKDKQGQYAAVDPAPLLTAGEKPTLKYRINESLSPLLAKLNGWLK
jgi:murein DD-endopeptidase MepM/ murein hydrolase activator NlpD